MLARLLQLIILGTMAAAVTLSWLLWSRFPVLTVVGVLLCFSSFVPILLVEFLVARRVNRADAVPQATVSQWTRAWLGEIFGVIEVFLWRQPFFWNAIPDQVEDAFGHRGRRGVVFIHGFICNRGIWTPWLRRLATDRRAFVAVNLEPVFGSIDAYRDVIDRAISKATLATGLPPLVVCHSMGGLAIRAWLAHGEGNEKRVHHIVTIGTPHHGTWLGRFALAPNGRQMRIDNPWMNTLAAGEPLARHQLFTCFYSNCDNIVFPARTAMLPGADNRLIPGKAHLALAFAPAVMNQTLAKLVQI